MAGRWEPFSRGEAGREPRSDRVILVVASGVWRAGRFKSASACRFTDMHELSMALNIVEAASEEARRHPNARVEAVHLEVGVLSGVVKDSLLFAWDFACEDTPLAGSRLEVKEIPVRIRCETCGAAGALGEPLELRCPACGGLALQLSGGRELQITALEIEECAPQG